MTIKERYLAVVEWLKDKDRKKVDFVSLNHHFGYDKPYKDFNQTIVFYDNIEESSINEKNLLLGDYITNIPEISNFMISKLGTVEELISIGKIDAGDEWNQLDWDNNEKSAGYCGSKEYQKIIDFWKKLDYHKIKSIMEDTVKDDYEIDLTGGRRYLMFDDLIPYLFNYYFYVLKGKDLYYCYSNLTENILYLPTNDEFEKMYNKIFIEKTENIKKRYNQQLNSTIHEFSKNIDYNHEVSELKKLLK